MSLGGERAFGLHTRSLPPINANVIRFNVWKCNAIQYFAAFALQYKRCNWPHVSPVVNIKANVIQSTTPRFTGQHWIAMKWYAYSNTLARRGGCSLSPLWQMCPLPPLSLVSKLVTKSPHRSNCSTSTTLFSWNLGFSLFLSQSVFALLTAHWICQIQQEQERRPIHGGLMQIGERLAPERPLSAQGWPPQLRPASPDTRPNTLEKCFQDKCLHMVQWSQINPTRDLSQQHLLKPPQLGMASPDSRDQRWVTWLEPFPDTRTPDTRHQITKGRLRKSL